MPLTFWSEGGEKRHRDTYFGERAEIWTHGDMAELTYTGGGYVRRRSDNTLKPGGVRIGISEIHAVCKTYPEIDDYLAFGAAHDDDEEVVLCLKPAGGAEVGFDLVKRIRARIRAEASPRHVPARVHVVGDVPYRQRSPSIDGSENTDNWGGALAPPRGEKCCVDVALATPRAS